jgi:hypothetical protein
LPPENQLFSPALQVFFHGILRFFPLFCSLRQPAFIPCNFGFYNEKSALRIILKAPLPLLTASLAPSDFPVNIVFAILSGLPNFL